MQANRMEAVGAVLVCGAAGMRQSGLDQLETMLARINFAQEIKRRLCGEREIVLPEHLVYTIAPDGRDFRTYMAGFGVDAVPVGSSAEWRFTKIRDVQEGDAVEITMLNSAGTEEMFSGQVYQVAVAEDGSKSYIVICPFQVGAKHLRVIVPVEDLEK